MVLPLLVVPDGSVLATLPGGQGEATFLSSTAASKPAAFRALVASPTDLQVTFGIETLVPYARLSGGGVNPIAGLPARASRRVATAALFALVAEASYECACWALSGSAT